MDSKILDEAMKAVESSKELSKDKVQQAKDAISKEKARIEAYVLELKKRGMESSIYKFVEKCLGNLKEFLYVVLGKCKELYEYVCEVISKVIPTSSRA